MRTTLCPLIKALWTPSWALFSGGIARHGRLLLARREPFLDDARSGRAHNFRKGRTWMSVTSAVRGRLRAWSTKDATSSGWIRSSGG